MKIKFRLAPKIVAIGRDFISLVSDALKQARESDLQILASSLAFITIVSLVPILAVSLSVFKAYGGFESLLSKVEPFILQNLAEASGAEATRYIRQVVARIHSGALGVTGVIGLLFTSTKLFHDVDTAVQRVWKVQSRRSLIKRLIVYWLLMFLGPLVLAVALGIIGSKDLGLIKVVPKDLIATVVTFVAFLSINKLVPAVKVSWRSAFVGSLLTTIVMALAQEFYGAAMKHLFKFGKMYGSLASIPLLLIWIHVCWWIALAGVALTAALERRRQLRSAIIVNGSETENMGSAGMTSSAKNADDTRSVDDV
jgi:membrane protein